MYFCKVPTEKVEVLQGKKQNKTKDSKHLNRQMFEKQTLASEVFWELDCKSLREGSKL
jgi:hypothetical protein